MNREAIDGAAKLGEPPYARGALRSPTCVRARHFSANEHHCSNRSPAVCALRGVQARLEARGE
jgi:hypothetical protein